METKLWASYYDSNATFSNNFNDFLHVPLLKLSFLLLCCRDDRSILLDCGEGTYSQLHCLYKEHTADVVASLRCVFISHRHPDHHMVIETLRNFYFKMSRFELIAYS